MPGVDAEIAFLTGGFVSKCFHHNLQDFFPALVEKLNFGHFFVFSDLLGEKKTKQIPLNGNIERVEFLFIEWENVS